MSKKIDRTGETTINTQGRLIKIVEYNNAKNMVVEFEDGTRVNGVQYNHFKKGEVCYPKDRARIGETALNNKGMRMRIVSYNSSLDIEVEFEDGERVNGVDYKRFKNGNISHPKSKNHIHETAINGRGHVMRIVKYINSQNMVVEFEDGTQVSNVKYSRFLNGEVRHPKDKNRSGEINRASNGQLMEIVDYIDSRYVMVKFFEENASPIKTTYQLFKIGRVKNPHFPMKGKGRYKTFQTEYAYTTPSGEVYFYCECQNCGWKKNMKADEAINCHHVCEEKEAENYAKKDR